MNRSSIFKIKIDFERSQGSYLFDKNTGKQYLDFFGQYATLALGYNHPVFQLEEYQSEVKRVSHQKITNCEMLADETAEFDQVFRDYTSGGVFTHYHYTCTGALAIEAAIKAAMDYKGLNHLRVISFKGSFHGINSYGGIVTDRFEPVSQRLKGFPGQYWAPLGNPIIEYEDDEAIIDEEKVNNVLSQIEDIIVRDRNVCSILVEPIQCTYGDCYFPESFFLGVRKLADRYDIPLIFDEIQVGFGGTGKVWYFQHLPIVPDIVVFGKKTQLSGIMVQKKFAKIFQKSIRLEVTWDADLMDMVRCKYVINAYQKYNILDNVRLMSGRLVSGLKGIDGLLNIRNAGLLVAFDFEEKAQRDSFMKSLVNNDMICNPTRDYTIRLRPNLCVTSSEVDHALEIMTNAAKCL
jgi:L-lysine 6-transaminase